MNREFWYFCWKEGIISSAKNPTTLYNVIILNLMQEASQILAPNYHQPIKVKGKKFMNFRGFQPPGLFNIRCKEGKPPSFVAVWKAASVWAKRQFKHAHMPDTTDHILATINLIYLQSKIPLVNWFPWGFVLLFKVLFKGISIKCSWKVNEWIQ